MGDQFSYLVDGQRKIYELGVHLLPGKPAALRDLLDTACHTLELLARDDDFFKTLERARDTWRERNEEARKSILSDAKAFSVFLSREMRLLVDYGVLPEITDMLRYRAEELRESLGKDHIDVELIRSAIEQLRARCCSEASMLREQDEAAAREMAASERARKLRNAAFFGIGGAIIVAADATAGALTGLGPIGVALSGGLGTSMMGDAIAKLAA